MVFENLQSDFAHIQISFDGIDFVTIQVPKVHYATFIKAWENKAIWKTGHYANSNTVSDIEYIRLGDVKRIKIM